MLAKIDAEIAWANAARLNVTVAYPQQWGTSLQRGTGRAGDTRVGYAFDIDFTPDPEYTFIEWRAYDTNELNRLYPNWINQNNVIRHLRSMPMLNDVDLPKFDLGGGSGKVKVNSDKVLNITLVPVSSEQPRIARSTPDDTTEIFQSARAISIVFAAPLRANTVIFARDHIEISSQRFDPETGNNIDQPIAIDGLINEETRRYANPLYNTMTNTITINPVNNGPEAHSIVTLRLGRQILSSNGSNLTAVTIRWKTGGEILTVIDPEAVYNSGSQEIIVTWDFEGPVAEAEVNWFINEDYNAIGSSGPITAGTNEYRISGVTELDITDITSLEIYEISISLFNAKGDEFEMDFDPLMVINAADSKSDAGITFIYDEDDLKNVSGYGMFFLREDINVYDWTPLGRTEPFRGIFHGLGKTITINSFANLGNNASYGVFETIEFAKISNLNVDYKDFILPILNPTNNNINAGGIAATMRHNNTIVNCTIRNGYKITLDVDTAPNSALWTINGAPSLWLAERQINDAENAYLIQTEFAYRVTNPASDEDTQGTLRHALKITHTNVSRIIFDNVEPGETTLTLATELPPIDKSLTIEGNGITLTRSWTVYTNIITQQLIRITSSTATVKISRVHFNNGRATNDGAAIYSSGNITLESCIFSGNQTSVANAWGAAVYNSGGKMTVKGCTFYNNTFTGNAVTTGIGGAIYSINSTASLILSGNLFYGNAGGSSNGFSVVRIANGTVTSEGYNVVDVDFGTASNRSGFNAHINGTDKYVTTVPISPYDAKLRTGGGAQGVITTLPPGYPTVDFYGNPITNGAAAGAVQTAHAGNLVFEVNNEANLRLAISYALDGDTISFVGVTPGTTTITLATPLPDITRNITIEGNGITLTRSWSASTSAQQLMRISSSANVKISRVHFRNGRSTDFGAAILNDTGGDVTLESCIFSGNQTTAGAAYGAAIRNRAQMTVRGCTFYNNTFTTSGHGGAIYSTGSLILSGNLFYGNGGSLMVQIAGGSVTSEGYNVVDRPFGTADNQSGFNAADWDITFTGVGFSANNVFPFDGAAASTTFTPRLGNSPANNTQLREHIPESWGHNMPAVDFYGNTRVWPGAPGAVQ